MEIIAYVFFGILLAGSAALFRGIMARKRLQKGIDDGSIELIRNQAVNLAIECEIRCIGTLSETEHQNFNSEYKVFLALQKYYPSFLHLKNCEASA
jgi:hypothetical protein